jgi:hypothetical protein
MPRPYPCVAALSREERAQAYMAYRVNYLPEALDRARRKVRALENEAARYGMTELLEVPPHG